MKKRVVKTATLGGEKCRVEQAHNYGEAWTDKMYDDHVPNIRIDDRLVGKLRLEVTIHEAMHIQRPRALEKTIEQAGKEIANLLWRLGYRREDE